MPQLADFNIFAVRNLKDGSTGQKILKSNQYYYLQKGYSVCGKEIILDSNESTMAGLYDDFIGREGSHLRVSVSAIVGANGSGKSSLVEYIIRILNNFASSVFGEMELHPETEHLHYIEGLNGELYYMLAGKPHLLSVIEDKVELYEYEKCIAIGVEDDSGIHRFKRTEDAIYLRDSRRKWRPDMDVCFYSKWRKKPEVYQRIADHIFYTFVSNYSLYAYNSNLNYSYSPYNCNVEI